MNGHGIMSSFFLFFLRKMFLQISGSLQLDQTVSLILKISFKHREHTGKKEHRPYLQVLATQSSSVTLTKSGDESQKKVKLFIQTVPAEIIFCLHYHILLKTLFFMHIV